jgi:hypothetical protein
LLVDIILKLQEVFESKKTDALSNAKKARGCLDVQNEFNANELVRKVSNFGSMIVMNVLSDYCKDFCLNERLDLKIGCGLIANYLTKSLFQDYRKFGDIFTKRHSAIATMREKQR